MFKLSCGGNLENKANMFETSITAPYNFLPKYLKSTEIFQPDLETKKTCKKCTLTACLKSACLAKKKQRSGMWEGNPLYY